jgi:hypothetical protein
MKRSQFWALILALSAQLTFAAHEGWQLVRSDTARDIRVYLRDVPGSSYKSFYATTRTKAGLASVVAVLTDVPALPEWIARLKAARLIKREGDQQLWVHSVYGLPYPFLEREAVLHSTLSQDKSGVVEIVTRAERGAIAASPHRVRLTNMHGVWRLTAETGGTVKIEMWGRGEPGGYMPPLLFNYNLPDEPLQTLRNLRQMLTREKYKEKNLKLIGEPS